MAESRDVTERLDVLETNVLTLLNLTPMLELQNKRLTALEAALKELQSIVTAEGLTKTLTDVVTSLIADARAQHEKMTRAVHPSVITNQ